MIKFRDNNGNIRFELSDNGDMKFADEADKKEFETKQEEVNKDNNNKDKK